MAAINVLMKPASGTCNMSCDYCFYCDESRKRSQSFYGFMSEQTLKNIIRKTMLNATGFASYAYQGGEPTLRGIEFYEQAVAYQQQYNRNNIRVQNAFQTNGLAIDEGWCRFFKRHNFLVGLSIDGVKTTHDCYRHDRSGVGTYERVVESARLLEHYQVSYNILTVVNKKVAEHIGEIYRDYKKRGWRYQQYIVCLDPLGEERGVNEYSLLPEQYGEFLTQLFNFWYQDHLQGEAPYIRQFDNYIGILKGYLPEACDQRGTCGIQNVIEADGSTYPCDFYMLDEYRIGNFNTDRFAEIEGKRIEKGFVKRSQKLNPECDKCEYYRLCRGGCQRHRDLDLQTGYYGNYFCKGYKQFFTNCYDKMLYVAKMM